MMKRSLHCFVAMLLPLLAFGAQANAAEPGVAGCEARNLDFGDKAVGWKHVPLSKLKRDTVYTKVKEDGHTVLRASADRSASVYAAFLNPPLRVPTSLSWRWKTKALVPGADNRDKKREDAPLRVLVAFDGDASGLPAAQQSQAKRTKTIAGQSLPYATLMYIWSEQVPVNTVIPSAHTSQLKMLVVSSGTKGLGSWQSLQRKLADDYRLAFGAEPGRVLGVGVMTDTDNTGAKAVGRYADIRLDCAGE